MAEQKKTEKENHTKKDDVIVHLEKEEKLLGDIKNLLKKDLEQKPESERISHTTETIAVEEKPSNTSPNVMDVSDDEESEGGSHLVRNIIIIIIGLGLIIGLFLFLKNQKTEELAQEQAAVTPSVAEEPTPTEEAVDTSKYSVTVLNGSGIPGIAAQVKTTLEEEKYIVDKTGNAGNQKYTKTVIQAGEDVPASFIEALRKTLAKSYDVDTTTEEITETTTSDIVIILGSTKAE